MDLSKKFNLQRKYELEKEERITFNEVLNGCFFVIKADVIKKIDFFDERTFLFGEERILGFKIKEIGMKQGTINDHECIHEHSKSINKNIKSVVKKYEILYESREIFYKHYLKIGSKKLKIFKAIKILSLLEKRIIFYLKSKIKNI